MEENILVKSNFSATINAPISDIRRRRRMKRITFWLVAVATLAGVVAFTAPRW